ncbi:ataxin 1 [Echinococcus multilocularis]|uniref:Ataxin 1 n=1 Tax=Echinococcus multilocularis TaxID=6211 RepID=A0A068Y444_ECHMU|nr:ataxin 1 [Echinococcus multilocularis]
MSLLPHQVTESGNHLRHFPQNTLFPSPNSVITPNQINTLKAITTLFTHFQGRESPQSLPFLPCPPSRTPAFMRSHKHASLSKRNVGSPFRRSGRVKLADESVQKIEGLKFSDFLQTAMSIGEERSLQWVKVERIFMETFLTGYQRGLIKIRFSLNIHMEQECTNTNFSYLPPVTIDHICSREQPFFIRSQGWSSYDPHLAQVRCGLSCQQLAVGDFCLALVSPEVANSLLPISKVQSDCSKQASLAAASCERIRDLFWSTLNQVSLSLRSQPNLSTCAPQEPLDLKKDYRKRTHGAVPSYFTAASLAQSPFKDNE